MTKSHAAQVFASIGVDIGKDVFHIVGFDVEGKIALRKKVKRLALEQEFQSWRPALSACTRPHRLERASP